MPTSNTQWVIPTLIGMVMASIRRFRRSHDERFLITLSRFAAHVLTCVFAGYVVAGILLYLDLPKLLAPLCAIAGLYGTTLVDWTEDTGLVILREFIDKSLGLKKRDRNRCDSDDRYH